MNRRCGADHTMSVENDGSAGDGPRMVDNQ